MERQTITEEELTALYDESLDEQGTITVAGLDYYPSEILQRVDPIAYGEGLNNYYDSISDEYYCEDME